MMSNRSNATRKAIVRATCCLWLCAAGSAFAAQERYGSFVDKERTMYLELDRIAEGKDVRLVVRNVPETTKTLYLAFSTGLDGIDMDPLGIPGWFGPDLKVGWLARLAGNELSGTMPPKLDDFTAYLQAIAILDNGEGRLSSMLEVRRSESDPKDPDVAFPLPLLTQEILPEGESGWDRVGEPVRVGVPLPMGAVQEIGGMPQLSLVGPSAQSQFSSLSYWPDGSVKWALAEYFADIDAETVNEDFSVDHGTGSSGGADLARVGLGKVTVETGRLSFVMNGNTPDLFDEMWLDGKRTLDKQDGNRLHLIDRNDVAWTYHPEKVVLEHNGPVRAQVHFHGWFTKSSDPDDVDRVYVRTLVDAWKGGTDVRVQVTLRNSSIDFPEHLLFRGLTWEGRLVEGGPLDVRMSKPSVEGDAPGEYSGQIDAGEEATYEQAFVKGVKLSVKYTLDHNDGSYKAFINRFGADDFELEGVRARMNGQDLTSGGNDGYTVQSEFCETVWMEGIPSDSDGPGVFMMLQHAKYTWPCELKLGGGGHIEVGLFPRKEASDGYHYPLTWGTSETRAFVLGFGTTPEAEPEHRAGKYDFPLAARAKLWVYNQSDVWAWDLVTPQQYQVFAEDSGLTAPSEAPFDVEKILYRFANGTGGGNNKWTNTRMFFHWLRTGDGGAYLRGLMEAYYKVDKIPFTLDDGDVRNRGDVRNEGEATRHGKFYNGSKHIFVQAVPDFGFGHGETYLLQCQEHFAQTFLDTELTSTRPGGSYTPGTYGAIGSATIATLQLGRHAELEQHITDYMEQWACMVFKQDNSSHEDTNTKGWQAPIGTEPGSPLNPDGYFVTRSNGKSNDWADYGYTTAWWTDGRLAPLSYHLFTDWMAENDPTNPVLGYVRARAQDWYHFSRRPFPDDFESETGDQFIHDIFDGDAGDEDVDPFADPGPRIKWPSETAYVLHPVVNFYLEQQESASALHYGLEMCRSISSSQWNRQSSDPTLNDFVYRYLKDRGLLQ